MRSAECQGKGRSASDLSSQFRIPHSALRIRGGDGAVKYHVRIGDRTVDVEVDGTRVTVGGEGFEAQLAPLPGTPLYHLLLAGDSWTVAVQPGEGPGRWALGVVGERVEVEALDERSRQRPTDAAPRAGPTGSRTAAARPARESRRAGAAGQAQADVHPAPERRGFRGDRQRRTGEAHRAQARAEALLPAHRVHGARAVHPAQDPAREASRARDRAGRVGDAPEDDVVAATREADAEGVCRPDASARGAAARAAHAGGRGGVMSSAITPELRWHAVGRRKLGVARVYLTPGSGTWNINGRTLGDYFPRASLVSHIQQPFTATDTLGAFDVRAIASGGGQTGQAGALRLAIARALCLADERHRKKLREQGLLTRDPRAVERKKPGRAGARKRFQFSKR